MKLKAHHGDLIRDPRVQKEAESKGRKVFETESEARKLSKINMNCWESRFKSSRRTPPKLP